MITVMDDAGTNEIHLEEVGDKPNQNEAAKTLWSSVNQARILFGGTAVFLHPGDHPTFPDSHGVLWAEGPKQWADAYVVCEGACAAAFTADAVAGQAVLFTNVDS